MTDASKADSFYRVYEEYAKTLRTWFVAYGVGAPVLILGNEALLEALNTRGTTVKTGSLFLFGVGVQVFIAALNKVVMWLLYAEQDAAIPIPVENRKKQRSWYYRWADRISEWFVIDFVADAATGVAFILGTLSLLRASMGTS